MVLRRCWIVLGAALCPLVQAQPDPSSRLPEIRRKIRRHLARLPDFTCVQTIERSHRAARNAKFQLTDRLRLEVAQVGERELFSWPGAGRFDDHTIGELIGGGMTGTGDFALYARSIFRWPGAVFTPAGEETLRGHRAIRYDYRISEADSRYRLTVQKKRARVPYHGSFWADAETLDLMRLTACAHEIPAALDLSEVVSTVDYAGVPLGDGVFPLPQTGESIMTGASGAASRNLAHFARCRQYSVDVTISFEARAEVDTPDSAVRAPIELRSGALLPARLETPIDSNTAAVGDPIRARLIRDVKLDGETIAPKGALLIGRIRRLEQHRTPQSYFAVALEFFRLEFDSRQATFAAELDDLDESPGLFWRALAATQSRRQAAIEDAILRSHPPWPGVRSFYMWGPRLTLPEGFRMVWKVVDAAPRP